jgi:hypothetical protein
VIARNYMAPAVAAPTGTGQRGDTPCLTIRHDRCRFSRMIFHRAITL